MSSSVTLVYSDKKGNVFDHPEYEPVFRSGNSYISVNETDLIPLPYGSLLFSLPGRSPLRYDNGKVSPVLEAFGERSIQAVSSFLSSGYLRTYLPAYEKNSDSQSLTLWAYCGVVFKDDQFFVPAIRIDEDPRSDPELHENDDELSVAIDKMKARYKKNRLVDQLTYCSTEYRCLCARNFFLGRFEAPVPTSPACNAKCLGCLSYQDDFSSFQESQYRLAFKPSVDEISDVIFHHLEHVDDAISSFGQGCEGEPLLRALDLSKVITLVRSKTQKGTIHLNTNGSLPDKVRLLADSGLDSIRISLNSPSEQYYNRYYQPVGYSLNDVKKSIQIALDMGLFVSLNLFFMPGFTDMESEVESLFKLLDKYHVDMIQTRNLNIDPDVYFEKIEFKESAAVGIITLLHMIENRYPDIKLGYYNPTRRHFGNK